MRSTSASVVGLLASRTSSPWMIARALAMSLAVPEITREFPPGSVRTPSRGYIVRSTFAARAAGTIVSGTTTEDSSETETVRPSRAQRSRSCAHTACTASSAVASCSVRFTLPRTSSAMMMLRCARSPIRSRTSRTDSSCALSWIRFGAAAGAAGAAGAGVASRPDAARLAARSNAPAAARAWRPSIDPTSLSFDSRREFRLPSVTLAYENVTKVPG